MPANPSSYADSPLTLLGHMRYGLYDLNRSTQYAPPYSITLGRSVVMHLWTLCKFNLFITFPHIYRAPLLDVCSLFSVIPPPEPPRPSPGRYHTASRSRHAKRKAFHESHDQKLLLRWTRPGKPKTVLHASLKFVRAYGERTSSIAGTISRSEKCPRVCLDAHIVTCPDNQTVIRE